MSGFDFSGMSVSALRSMLRAVVSTGPSPSDAEFIKALANEIAKRQRAESGNG